MAEPRRPLTKKRKPATPWHKKGMKKPNRNLVRGRLADGRLRPPLPPTPDALLAECETLRRRLIGINEQAAIVSLASSLSNRLWDAMRLLGGAVPSQPCLEDSDETAAFVDAITGQVRL